MNKLVSITSTIEAEDQFGEISARFSETGSNLLQRYRFDLLERLKEGDFFIESPSFSDSIVVHSNGVLFAWLRHTKGGLHILAYHLRDSGVAGRQAAQTFELNVVPKRILISSAARTQWERIKAHVRPEKQITVQKLWERAIHRTMMHGAKVYRSPSDSTLFATHCEGKVYVWLRWENETKPEHVIVIASQLQSEPWN